MTEFAIEAPARAAAFLAQLAHESGQFRFMEEIWGPTPAQRRYEPQSTLATTSGTPRRATASGSRDAVRSRSRDARTIAASATCWASTCVADPARAAVPDLAFRIAGLFWSKKGLNELADRATRRRVSRDYEAHQRRLQRPGRPAEVLRGRMHGARGRRGAAGAARGPFLPVPEEPTFERGHEAIRTLVRPQRKRKAAPATRKAKTARASSKTRKAKTGARKAKTARKSTRKAAAPRRKKSR